jgi:hypothetical protein
MRKIFVSRFVHALRLVTPNVVRRGSPFLARNIKQVGREDGQKSDEQPVVDVEQVGRVSSPIVGNAEMSGKTSA